jgi:hypothetical protein
MSKKSVMIRVSAELRDYLKKKREENNKQSISALIESKFIKEK